MYYQFLCPQDIKSHGGQCRVFSSRHSCCYCACSYSHALHHQRVQARVAPGGVCVCVSAQREWEQPIHISVARQQHKQAAIPAVCGSTTHVGRQDAPQSQSRVKRGRGRSVSFGISPCLLVETRAHTHTHTHTHTRACVLLHHTAANIRLTGCGAHHSNSAEGQMNVMLETIMHHTLHTVSH
jgi:hypothetical protein